METRLFLPLLLLLCASVAQAVCPDPTLGETQLDCPWAQIARDLGTVAAQNGDVATALKQESPSLTRELVANSSLTDWKALWGESINFDELAKGSIVDPSILNAMAKLFGVPSPHGRAVGPVNRLISHAGMEHTYGYLFSLLHTAFGYKRARWVQGEIEKGFGVTAGLFSPTPGSGTLFTNVTYFAGKIAFRDLPLHSRRLDLGSGVAAPELTKFDFTRLKPIRVEETTQSYVLRTDLVPFLEPSGGGDSYWLVYSVVDPNGPRLVTAFPVAQSFVNTVTDPTTMGDGKPIITRYNAYVEGLSGRTDAVGTRKVIR